jgi:hypothetical protein
MNENNKPSSAEKLIVVNRKKGHTAEIDRAARSGATCKRLVACV